MVCLAFDTAGPYCSAAIARSTRGAPEILARASERIGRGHAEHLPQMVDEVLDAAAVGYADLTQIAVTTGPGSFTGVRIGIAFARGLALARDIPAIGIGSLEAIAAPLAATREGTVAALLDAKRGEVFALVTDMASGAALIEAQALSIDDLVLRLSHMRAPIVMTGVGAPIVAGALAEPKPRIVGTAEAPDIADVIALADRAEHVAPPLPIYARPADAKPQADKAVPRR